MTIVYTIEHFKFQYPNTNATISIDGTFNVNHGDIVLLQGNSGSGKSTLLLGLKGIIPLLINGQSSGNILFHGQNITTLKNTGQIGYLGQNPHNQLICNNVYQELAFGLENQALEPIIIRQKIEAYSIRFKISHLLEREVKNLSGGEKQKINLLSILIMEPEVLLLDEPTAFLDPENALEIISIIKEVSKNKTVIIIEHNIHYLKNILTRVIRINKHGQINEYNPLTINFSPQLTYQACKSRENITNNSAPLLLQIKNLHFVYKTQKLLLSHIELNIKPGEIIGIIGKNGSGKSTLLKLISKIITSKNNIYYKQQDIYTIKTNRYWQEISLLWQNPENHFLYSSVSDELQNNHSLMNLFALNEVAKQNPYCLSEGQKRRLSLAICMRPNIQLFLLDEPTFGQDLDNKQKLAKLISSHALANKSFIIVSHDIAFLEALTNNIYNLDTGGLHLET